MKSILSTVALVATFAVSEGMIYPPFEGTIGEQIGRIQEAVRPHLPGDGEGAFDRDGFINRLNLDVRERAGDLLQEALSGREDSLSDISEDIRCGLIDSNFLFERAVTSEEKMGYIYGISMQVLTDSVHGILPQKATVTALRNLFLYCGDELVRREERWVLVLRQPVSAISFQMQWDRQRGVDDGY